MNKGKYVFSQLLDFLDKDVFLRISNKYNGNRYVKSFTCWNQLAVKAIGELGLAFAAVSNAIPVLTGLGGAIKKLL